MVVLIPSYQPDSRLVDVVRTLRESAAAAEVLVVDDGSIGSTTSCGSQPPSSPVA